MPGLNTLCEVRIQAIISSETRNINDGITTYVAQWETAMMAIVSFSAKVGYVLYCFVLLLKYRVHLMIMYMYICLCMCGEYVNRLVLLYNPVIVK